MAGLLLTAGAGPTLALDRADDEGFARGHVIRLLERIGSFVTDLVIDLGDVFHKEGAETGPDG